MHRRIVRSSDFAEAEFKRGGDVPAGENSMKRPSAVLAVFFAMAAHGAGTMYDESADAHSDIRAALVAAGGANLPVLVIFGANWCGDCKVLDLAMKSGSSAPLVLREFRVVKVDVGRFDHNVDIAQSYGVPLKEGIPAAVVLSPTNEVLYATRAGELADARHMGETGIYDFFKKVSSGPRPNS